MFRLFRPIERGEFFVAWGDTAQGGTDSNFVQFLSKTRGDIPFVLQMTGVAAEMTPHLRMALEWICDITGVKPVVCLERQNGGASAMHDLITTNHQNKYVIYYMRDEKGRPTDKPGWDTTGTQGGGGTRPMMLGEWLVAFNAGLIKIYDQVTLDQHSTFIVNKHGKPEADAGCHDDGVISCAGAYQMYQTENPTYVETDYEEETSRAQSNFMVN
jgi:hypothetical protein